MRGVADRYFFSGGSPAELATFRSLFYVATLPYLALHYRFAAWDFPASLHQPIAVHVLLPLPPLTAAWSAPLYFLVALAALASATGAGGIFSRAAFFTGALYLFGNRYAFGVRLGQVDSPVLLCALVMIAARCDDALSPLRRRRPGPSFAGEYSWPPQFVRLFFALFFLEAGLAKLRNAGWAWASADALRTYLIFAHPPGVVPPPPQAFLLARPALTASASWATLVFELAGPLALGRGRIATAYAAVAFAFLISVRLLLGHPFVFSLLPLFAAYLPLARIGNWAAIRYNRGV